MTMMTDIDYYDDDQYSITSLEWLRDRYKDKLTKFDYADYQDEVFLDTIIMKEEHRGKGYGTSFISDLCEYADNNKKSITLIPSNNLGTSVTVLEKFYGKFGFAYGKQSYDNHLMIRDYRHKNRKQTTK